MLINRITALKFLTLPLILAETSKNNTGDQPQAFTFGYPSSPLLNSVVLPVTPSCPTPLIISALTTTNNKLVSDPVAPYTLVVLVHEQLTDDAGVHYGRIYARSMGIGNMDTARSLRHPWANGTQFIGCIWSSNGISGGCQDLMTITSSDSTSAAYANSSSECRIPSVQGSWVTSPPSTLDVDIEHPADILASNGWPSSCSDIRVTPKNGTAPYTLLIAPAFHPPLNITSTDRSPMNYTVRLTHGQAFMLGVFDSAGNSFAFGPLHAGRADDVGCLAVLTGQEWHGGGGVGIGSAVGAAIGSLLIGALGAGLAIWGIYVRKEKRRPMRDRNDFCFGENTPPRPTSHRGISDQSSYANPNPLDPYEDSPQRNIIPFDTPESLYDPYAPTIPNAGSRFPRDGSSTSLAARQSDFGLPLGKTRSRDEQHTSVGSRTSDRSSRPSDPRHHSFPSASGSAPQNRYSATDSIYARNTPQNELRLVGSPIIVSPSTGRAEAGSSGDEYGDPYRSTNSRMGGSSGKTSRPVSRQRPLSGGRQDEGDESQQRARNVYVVHSDGGAAGDVHIQLPDGGARVIELPPNYQNEASMPRSPPLLSPPLISTTGARPGVSPSSPRSISGGSIETRSAASFGPRQQPRPASAHSSSSPLIPSTGDYSAARRSPNPFSPPSIITQSTGSGMRRTKSGMERVEAAYLALDLTNPDDRHPLSPPLDSELSASRYLPDEKMKTRTSEGARPRAVTVVSEGEIKARAEAAMAEKLAREN